MRKNGQLKLTLVLVRWLAHDWSIAFLLFLLALLIRIPYLYDVPRFIDEWREIGLSAQIARGEVWPLHNTSHDIGAFHNYVLAGLFTLFGFNEFIPRLYVAITSAGTVVVTFWIARHWAGKIVATIAALLLTTNSMHILVTHMAWSNDTTPFFVSLAVLTSLKAMDQKKKRSLWALSGLTWAVALQTHPSVVAALLGVLFYIIRQFGWRALYRDTSVRFAMIVFLVGYSNMIIHNLIRPLDSVLWMKRKDYALHQDWSFQGYFMNIAEMGMEWIRSLASAFPDGTGWLHGISSGLMIIFVLGIVDGFRRLSHLRDGTFILAIVISSFLVIPILNDQYKFYIWTRYIAYLFPICMIPLGISFHAWARERVLFRTRNGSYQAVLVGGFVVSLLLPLHHFYQYAEYYMESGQDNSAEFLAIKTLETRPEKPALIAVDKQVKQAEAVSKMLRVKGFKSPLVGVDPNEVRTVEALSSEAGNGVDATFYNRWKKVLAESKSENWYVLSLENKQKLTSLFNITWVDEEIIAGHRGNPTYFIGRITSLKYF